MMTQCINFEMLAGYFGGSLSDEDKVWMMKHISSCPECLEQVASASEVMESPHLEEWEPASDEVTQYALKTLKTAQRTTDNRQRTTNNGQQTTDNLVNRIIEWVGSLFRIPQPVLVRSEAAAEVDCQLNVEIGDVHIKIHLEESEDDKAAIKVMLHKGPENISLMLMGESGKLFARNLRENAARFDDIPFDAYQLIVEQNGHEIGEYLFEISEKGLYERDLMA